MHTDTSSTSSKVAVQNKVILSHQPTPPWEACVGVCLTLCVCVAKGERGHPTRTRTRVYRVPNMRSDRHTKEPGSMAWQPEHTFTCRDDHIVTNTLSASETVILLNGDKLPFQVFNSTLQRKLLKLSTGLSHAHANNKLER